jgi:SNF2 family DNA or RNA helicase
MSIVSRNHPAGIDIRLLSGSRVSLRTVNEGQFASRELYHLRLQAEHALLVSGFDELICLDLLRFAPFDYQVRAAQIMLRRFRGRGMLCDEVGLGKTIEAGLIIKEYLARSVVQRILIITPAALVEQWREELAVKFGLPDFTTSADPEFRTLGEAAWERFPHLIASLATARRSEHRAALAQIPYDLVIVDEAHHLKNRNSASWKFINDLQRKYILLLTATPVENNLDELYNLITLLKPGQLKTPREFRKQFVVRGDPRLPKNRGQLRELLGDVMVRHTRSQVHLKLPPRQANTLRLPLTPEEAAFYSAVSDYVREHLKRTGPNPDRSYQAPEADPDEGQNLSSPDALRQVDRFALLTLKREIGSSPQAAEPTLRALAARAKDPVQRQRLTTLAEQAAVLTPWAKAEPRKTVAQPLARPCRKSAHLHHFRRTLNRLAERLRAMGVSLVTYHGEMDTPPKPGH